jgi:hypothetical protein
MLRYRSSILSELYKLNELRSMSSMRSNTPKTQDQSITSMNNTEKIHIASTVIDPKRFNGICKKMIFRLINRNVIARIAKRASIGIPILGVYLSQRLLRNDMKQAMDTNNSDEIRNGYYIVSGIDAIDFLSQTIMISSLTTTLFFPELAVMYDLNLAEYMKYADKASIGAAISSCIGGTYLEMKQI